MHLYTKYTYKHTLEKTCKGGTVLTWCNLSADNTSWYRCIMYTICAQGTRVTYTQLHLHGVLLTHKPLFHVLFSSLSPLECYLTELAELHVARLPGNKKWSFAFLYFWLFGECILPLTARRLKIFTVNVRTDLQQAYVIIYKQTFPCILPLRPRFCYEQ